MIGETQRYRDKLMSADAAAALIPDGARICMALGVAQPPALLDALARRAEAGGIEGASLYYLLSTSIAGRTVLRRDLRHRLRPMSLFHSAIERTLNGEAVAAGDPDVDFIPVAFSRVPRMLRDEIGVDTLITQVAPPDEHGNFSLGTNIDYAHGAARSCERVIVEVNPRMPRVGGDSMIPFSVVTAIVEHDQPLIEIPSAARRPQDEAIGAIIAGMIEDGSCLQMGIGAVPEAVCAALHGHRYLGIHSELLTPGLAGLMQAGVADNSRKEIHRGRTIFTFAMGDRGFYDFLHDNPALEGHPVDYVNDAAVIARHSKMVSINATLEVDLHGACNSEAVDGRQYSAAGGQLDFVRGAGASIGGKSIIACHATAAGGAVSRIVPRLSGPVTTPRNDVHIVVTEFGAAHLRGKSLVERGEALIAIAHPKFRDALTEQLHTRRAG
ncbi:acetyl-CoA hydrolase/transferase family protein [Sphingomonas sp. Y38-1Y]|uniref:acetyl-CoA hydrolase/transferase family protein n=1 Tax=Sphingomonas sp. Y38-1Y TaxID=3078265 RepID=UPI0028E6AA51|nr:acetyl-CoA hydrolase/transferase C-terminal domain-containing protein [Sphingomonas sp. Y38-1Y]